MMSISPDNACVIYHLHKRMPFAKEIGSYEFPEVSIEEGGKEISIHAVIIKWRTDQFHVRYTGDQHAPFSVNEVTNREGDKFGLSFSNKAILLEALLNCKV